ncbi:MAG: hypothetical protein WA125_00130 [Desulfosporosinus sp.]
MGSGDSFAAGTIYCLLTDMEPQECVEFAPAGRCL